MIKQWIEWGTVLNLQTTPNVKVTKSTQLTMRSEARKNGDASNKTLGFHQARMEGRMVGK
jgi:hypothetical protein